MICLLSAAGGVLLAATGFELSWQHSVARTRWEEHWVVGPEGLRLTLARIEGPGAGMEAPSDARREGTTWTWLPQMRPLRELRLAASGETGSGWTLCAAGRCQEIGKGPGEDVVIFAPASPGDCPSSPFPGPPEDP